MNASASACESDYSIPRRRLRDVKDSTVSVSVRRDRVRSRHGLLLSELEHVRFSLGEGRQRTGAENYLSYPQQRSRSPNALIDPPGDSEFGEEERSGRISP